MANLVRPDRQDVQSMRIFSHIYMLKQQASDFRMLNQWSLHLKRFTGLISWKTVSVCRTQFEHFRDSCTWLLREFGVLFCRQGFKQVLSSLKSMYYDCITIGIVKITRLMIEKLKKI